MFAVCLGGIIAELALQHQDRRTMKTLFLSLYLDFQGSPDAMSFRWGEYHISPADFQCVVLDMKLDENPDHDNPVVYYGGYPFYSLFDDIVRLLQAGGVVLCLNHYTYVNKDSTYGSSEAHKAMLDKRRHTLTYEYKHRGGEETSYDWLEQGFLQSTRLDRMLVRPGKNYKLLSNKESLKLYFMYVKQYHKVIQGISDIQYGPSTWKGELVWLRDTGSEPGRDEAEILAVTEVTNEPIAAAIKYSGFLGTLVLLPTYQLPPLASESREASINSISRALIDLGKYYYELNREKLGIQLEAPPWLLDFRTKPAVEADKELAELETARTNLLSKRDRYDRMLALINGYGDSLQKAVGELFGEEWLGFNVEETEPGHPIDLFVKNPRTGQVLAVQVTGVVGKFTQSDKHFGALMSYLPEHEERNVGGQIEKVVLVVNTYRDMPLGSRTDSNDISVHVSNLVERNKICLIRSCDVYYLWNLWVDSPNKLSADDIFKQLFDCEGIWQRKK